MNQTQRLTKDKKKSQDSYQSKLSPSEIKEKLEEKEGIKVSQQRLVFEGRSMENDKTMADFGITAGKCLHMVLSLRGGSSGCL